MSQPGVPESSPAGTPVGPDRRGRNLRVTLEWVGVVVLALAAAFLVKTFVLQTFFIPSASMEPTLHVGDRVFVNKLAYSFHSVHRGDVVVFTLPPGESAGTGVDDLIKRVIGLPGETVEARNGRIYIDGRPLSEPWLPRGVSPVAGLPLERQRVPADHYFLMGDNRGDSSDSRHFGPISGDLIVGRAFVRIWPFSHLGFL
ncbi:MAG TPA: signal peptidase I [Acidimicrobiales bacterium]|nr:signal peptidase I [Acidimicrobiales bacterium]